jgi:deazaflavin-dependent oxidoreductase (nitroreductase family)
LASGGERSVERCAATPAASAIEPAKSIETFTFCAGSPRHCGSAEVSEGLRSSWMPWKGPRLIGQDDGMAPGRDRDDPTGVTESPIRWVADHVRQYVETAGRDGHRRYGHDCLLLITRGRTTGQPRRTALFYWRDRDRYLVVPSNGGLPAFPDWYLNLLADPHVVVQVGAEVIDTDARTATAAEWPRLWRVVISGLPRYARYAEKAGRDLPIVVLRPR